VVGRRTVKVRSPDRVELEQSSARINLHDTLLRDTVASVKLRTSPVTRGLRTLFLHGHRGVVRFFQTITRGAVRYFRTVTSVAHFRVIASEVVFGVNFLAISLKTLRCAQQLTKLFMFLYQKGGSQPKMFPPGHTIRRALANRTTTPAIVTNHLVCCSRSVIISPYVVFRAALLGRRTYLNTRYSTLAIILNRLPQETWRRVVQNIVVLLADGRVDRPPDLRRGPANILLGRVLGRVLGCAPGGLLPGKSSS
jgi:hypothetical protein